MGKITVEIPDDLENEFRDVAIHKFGKKRGHLKKAGIEAIKLYVDNAVVEEGIAMGLTDH
ncbi:hypothetical protein [Candidatus Borrarchaeum sp.]|uniref:hypothetical protein n=1 Tax=Candidatus Borrarchaeum sp. TaxID=2846742 RepID=UPI00257A6D9B|nr:hypothetical protein [Candidatus Borrarchaeum sp.]